MPWTLLATKSSSSQASTFWYRASAMASRLLPTPWSPARTRSAGRDSSTLGVESSVALRTFRVRLLEPREVTWTSSAST